MAATTPSLPETMHAWRKHRGDPTPHYDTIPVPSTPSSGFLVKILAAGVCHSDVPLVADDGSMPNSPFFREKYVLGHEGCGEIVTIGADVPTTGTAGKLKVGDRVAINPVAGCEDAKCPECGNGLPQLCQNPDGCHHGLGQDGSFAEYVAVPHRAVVKVPEGVSNAAAAVATDAVMTSHHAVIQRAKVKKEDTVFIFGLGGLGFNALQILLGVGCTLYVYDTRQGPLDEAIKVGLPESNVVPAGKDVKEWVKNKGLENKIDIVIDFAGAQQTFSDAEVIVRRGGTILNVGLLDHSHKTNHLSNIVKAITVLYTFGGHTADIVEGMNKIAAGTLTPRVETAPMKEFPTVLKDLHEGRVKSRMVLVPESVAG